MIDIKHMDSNSKEELKRGESKNLFYYISFYFLYFYHIIFWPIHKFISAFLFVFIFKKKEEELKRQKEEELIKQKEEELKKQEEEIRKKKEEELKRKKEEELKKEKEERMRKKKEILERQEKLRKEQLLNKVYEKQTKEEKVKEVLEDMCVLGDIMKEEIIEEKEKEPEKFISIEEATKEENKSSSNFCLGLLAQNLENGNYYCYRKKSNK